MKKLISALLTAAAVISVLPASPLAASNDAALGTVVYIRHSIDSHMSQIRKKNEKLLKLLPEELSETDFSDYDTSSMLLGGSLYDFSEPSNLVCSASIEDVISGKENTVNTIAANKYAVHSIEPFGGYAELFPSDTVLRAAGGRRARLICSYPENITEYQIVKDKKNIYIENIDFSDFPMIKFENCENIIINNCSFTDFLDNGLVFRGCRGVSVVNCSFTDCGKRISDATSSGCSIRVVGDKKAPSENILIENCTVNHSYGKAVSFAGTVDNYIIRSNSITNTVWGAIDYWGADISGGFANIIENNECINTGSGAPSPNDAAAKTSGVGCAAIFAGGGEDMPKSIVKNNTVKNTVETGIEGPYEIVYHNTVKNTGEKSAVRYTGSTEAVYIKPSDAYEQKYVDNVIETRGIRCFSSYSNEDEEYKGIYIINNELSLKKPDSTITSNYNRSDIEINCKKLKKLVISGNSGMMTDKPSVDVYLSKGYVMDYFDLNNRCMIGSMPESARYCFSINNF